MLFGLVLLILNLPESAMFAEEWHLIGIGIEIEDKRKCMRKMKHSLQLCGAREDGNHYTLDSTLRNALTGKSNDEEEEEEDERAP